MNMTVRRYFPFILALSMILSVLLFVLPNAQAAGEYDDQTTLELTGKVTDQKFKLTANDLNFFQINSAAPGDTWKGAIHIQNKTGGGMEVSVFDIVNNLKDDSILFEALELEICIQDQTCYAGDYSVSHAKPVTDYYYIEPGKSMTFDVTVSLPAYLDNTLQNKVMDSNWILSARYHAPTSDQGGSGTPSSLKYYVYYVDEYGNELADTKIATGPYGQEITEYAKSIEGYTATIQKKTLRLTEENREIIFIYRKGDQSSSDADGSGSGDSSNNSGSSSGSDMQGNSSDSGSDTSGKPDSIIQTGRELLQSSPNLSTIMILLLLSLIAVAISFIRLIHIRNMRISEEIKKADRSHGTLD